MANVFANTSNFSGILKNYYKGPMIDALNESLPIHRACEKVKEGWSGLQVVRPVRVSRQTGIGATSDGGVLPQIGKTQVVQANIAAKYNYCRTGVTGPMIKSSMSDIGSFVRSQAYQLKTGFDDLKNDLNRQLSWNGDGTLATVNTAATASVALVIAGRESTTPALQFLDTGMAIDIYSSAGAVKASGVIINAISGSPSAATATLTLSIPVTAAATDVLVRAGSYGYELQGLLYALDGLTTTIYNIDRSVYMAYQGNVISNGGLALTIDAMQNAYNEALRRGNVQKLNASYCDFASLRYYQKLLTADKRYANTQEGDGTFGSKGNFYLSFMDTPVVPDKDCPTRFFFLPAEVLKHYILCELEAADESGSTLIPQSESDQFESRLRYFSNLFNEQPAACGVLKSYISP